MTVRIEGTVYKDDGCHLFPSCLTCPRAKCIYDEPEDEERRRERDAKLTGMLAQGMSNVRCAELLGVSTRTIIRIKERQRTEWLASIQRPQFRKSAFKVREPADANG